MVKYRKKSIFALRNTSYPDLTMNRSIFPYMLLGIALSLLWMGVALQSGAQREKTPLLITDIKVLPDGRFLVTEKGTKQLSLYNSSFANVESSWNFDQTPTGVAFTTDYLFVTTFDQQGELHVINRSSGKEEKMLRMQSGARAPIVNLSAGELYVLNQFSNSVTAIDLASMTIKKQTHVLREPRGAVMDKAGKYLFVTNFLPQQRADVDTVTACVSVIDLATFTKKTDIPLYNGSNALRDIALTEDGKYVLITHNLGRFQVPTNQLQQGWMNTSGVSLISTESLTHEGTVLLDDPDRGAAGIWGVVCVNDRLIISHSGTHEISVIDYPQFIERFEAYPQKEALAYDLRFLYGMRERIELHGNGPRSFVVSGSSLYIPTYFTDIVNVVSLSDLEVKAIPLVSNREPEGVLLGEMYFNDAAYCFQNWQSCNGCHPGDGRTDGMNWDLMNDGIGNSKNCKSMLYSHVTPPSMISGIRAMAEIAVRRGFNLIQFYDIPEENALLVDEYLKALRPVPSPYLVDGNLSEKAIAGRKVFEKLECNNCHSGPYYTDMKMHRIGEDIEFENGWDTPTLIEVWRTAPYLFDGRAATMMDVFETHKHGINKKVTKKELEELVEYVNSL